MLCSKSVRCLGETTMHEHLVKGVGADFKLSKDSLITSESSLETGAFSLSWVFTVFLVSRVGLGDVSEFLTTELLLFVSSKMIPDAQVCDKTLKPFYGFNFLSLIFTIQSSMVSALWSSLGMDFLSTGITVTNPYSGFKTNFPTKGCICCLCKNKR